MRIVRVKLSQDVEDFLENFCHTYAISDRTFVHDVYALVTLKGAGLPDKARTDKLAEHYAKELKLIKDVARAMIAKRTQVLGSMVKTGMFQYFVSGKSVLNDLEFTEQLIVSFKKLHVKLRQSQCMTCPMLSSCDFGRQYSDKVRDITIVVDADYKKKVAPNCPHEPEIELMSQLANSASFMNSLGTPEGQTIANVMNEQAVVEGEPSYGSPDKDPLLSAKEMRELLEAEEEALKASLQFDSDLDHLDFDDDRPDFAGINNGYGSGLGYDAKHTRGNSVYLNPKIIDQIKVTQLAIYQLAMKLEAGLHKNKKGLFAPTENLTPDRKDTQIKSFNDVGKVKKMEHAESEGVFITKLAKKAMQKVQQLMPAGKKQLLYVLVDFSGSMQSYAGVSPILGFINRAALTASFVIALARRVRDDGGMLFFRGFAYGTTPLRFCRTKEQFDALEQFVATAAFNGGGTNIYRALENARDDIMNNRGEISKAEILLITDAQDSFDTNQIKVMRGWFDDIPISTLDTVGGTGSLSGAARCLRELSDNYYKVDPTKNSVASMIDLVGGKKKKKETV